MASRKRKALARSPIDGVLSPPEPAKRKRASQARKKKTTSPKRNSKPAPARKRVAHTVRIDAELLDECRAAVIALAGAPLRLTLSDLVESALQRELKRLKRQHNDGADFPAYGGKLRAGRPIGS